MDLFSLLHGHRSIREYQKGRPVPDELLDEIFTAAVRGASSSGNMQTYSIIVTTDPELRQQLFKPHMEQEMVLDAPVLVTFCADFRRMRKWLRISEAPMNFDNFMSFMIATIDATLVSQNVALAAESKGLGICYMGSTLANCDQIGAILKCPEGVVPVVGFSLGWPAESPAPRDRLPRTGLIHREVYSDHDDSTVSTIYANREQAGWKRYMSYPELRKMIEGSDVENLAQIYTKLKYTKESHIEYSHTVLKYLDRQNFMNNEMIQQSTVLKVSLTTKDDPNGDGESFEPTDLSASPSINSSAAASPTMTPANAQ